MTPQPATPTPTPTNPTSSAATNAATNATSAVAQRPHAPQDHPAGAVFTNDTPTSAAGGVERVAGKIDPHAVTISGVVLGPSYSPTDSAESLRNIPRDLPEPGRYPFTRGLFAQGYRTRLWTMRQFAGFGSADDTNQRFKYLLAQAKGTAANTGLSTAFDLPTLMGRDSDDPLSAGEVGKCGVAISTVEDMHRLYADIPIDRVTVSQTINGPACVIWALYLAMARQRGIGWESLGGTLQNDILKEFHAQNEFIYPPEASVKLVVDTIEFQTRFMPKWNSVSISGYHIREAGSTATQELAFTLRDGMEYVEACLERGLPIDSFAPRLSFFFNSHNEFFEEVCKLRAARRIWARMMRDRYGAASERSWFMKTHVQTAGCSLTEQQPLNNIVRVAYQAMAAVLGGCQSLHTDSMDETLGLPTEQAVTVALRTQQILAHETGVTRVTDPLGGSWFIEHLTDTIEAGALDFIAEIDAMGAYGLPTPAAAQPRRAGVYAPRASYGRAVVNGINKGYFRRQIAEASYRFSQECEAGDRLIVGVNAYAEPDEKRPIDILQISEAVETEQNRRLATFRKARDAAAVARALDNIRAACRSKPYSPGLTGISPATAGLHPSNTMPALVDAALAGATLGEMVQAMADVYGRYTSGPEW
ncbi:MAG: methylmalonyl-CoA mutase [Planctomyces sp.]|nr:methylmalonyl-CoA mutase [Planctomyces sp.]